MLINNDKQNFRILFLMAIMLSALVSPARADNLLLNGSFETTAEQAAALIKREPPANVGVWELKYVTCHLGCGPGQRYSLPTGTASRPVPDGKYALTIGNSFDPGTAVQSFTTQVGQIYSVSLWAVNSASFEDGQGSVRIFGSQGDDLNEVFTVGFSEWKQFTFSFTAQAETSTIEIKNLGSGGKSSHDALIIDDVRVEIPSLNPTSISPSDGLNLQARARSSTPILSAPVCRLATDKPTCSTIVSVFNTTGKNACLWQLKPTFKILTCHGGTSQSWNYTTTIGALQQELVLTNHIGWPKPTKTGYNLGAKIASLTLLATQDRAFSEGLDGRNCELENGLTQCESLLYVQNTTGKNTCLWRLAPTFSVLSCVGGTVADWSHPILRLEAAGQSFALTTHIDWPAHTRSGFNSGTRIANRSLKAVPAQAADAAYLFMDSIEECKPDRQQYCYMSNTVVAREVVGHFSKLNVKNYMLPSAGEPLITLFGDAVKSAGARYYTQERWEIYVAQVDGIFNCKKYMTSRRAVFERLVDRHGTAFRGISLKDEPSTELFANQKRARDCIKGDVDKRIASLDVFLNLYPINANDNALEGGPSDENSTMSLKDMGYPSCNGREQFNLAHRTFYENNYVYEAAGLIKPDQLAFDLYLQDSRYLNCLPALIDMMHLTMTMIRDNADAVRAEPLNFLQTFTNLGFDRLVPSAPQMKWYSAWSFAHGIKRFGYFLSHNMRPMKDVTENYNGLLNAVNIPNPEVFDPVRETYNFIRIVQNELGNATYAGLTAPIFNLPRGGFVHWIPSSDVIAGSYQDANPQIRYVVLVKKPQNGQINGLVSLDKWYRKVEEYNFADKQWVPHAENRATHQVNYSLDALPLMLVRLTQ
ncbi:MAG: DUF642 domain-containing protein [Rhizobiales bacterium]|nr:DUF642 domain-containing protein [Hyphomicrobiales bacterium]NRB15857.1 DUF642 domain-containing protein [Hyphomicrobiales bacterium]